MYIILWEYIVRPGQQIEFENIYGADGDWAQLFGRADGYLGTELIRDMEKPGRFITIDRWISPAAFDSFRDKFHAEYEAIDARCEHLTEQEVRRGAWSSIPSSS